MSLLVCLVIGVVIGIATSYWLERSFDFAFISSLVGLAGSILGLILKVLLVTSRGEPNFWSWKEVIFCTLGALVCVLVFSVIHKAAPKRAAHEEHVEENSIDEG